jgi:hypothetical protein
MDARAIERTGNFRGIKNFALKRVGKFISVVTAISLTGGPNAVNPVFGGCSRSAALALSSYVHPQRPFARTSRDQLDAKYQGS